MSGVSDDAVQLVAGLLGHIRQIVGEGASYAMLHYGAVEEGKRLGSGYGTSDLPKLLERMDGVLAHRSEVLKDDVSSVTVRIHDSPFLKTNSRPAVGILVGLLEGALSSSRQGRYKGQVLQPSASGETTIELKREG